MALLSPFVQSSNQQQFKIGNVWWIFSIKKTSTLHNFIPNEHILLKTKDEMKDKFKPTNSNIFIIITLTTISQLSHLQFVN